MKAKIVSNILIVILVIVVFVGFMYLLSWLANVDQEAYERNLRNDERIKQELEQFNVEIKQEGKKLWNLGNYPLPQDNVEL